MSTLHQPVPLGPRAYRSKLRSVGPLMALVPPAILGAISLLLLRHHTSLVRGAAGFLTAVVAAPGLLVVGAPLRSGRGVYLLAIAGSAVLWVGLGGSEGRGG